MGLQPSSPLSQIRQWLSVEISNFAVVINPSLQSVASTVHIHLEYKFLLQWEVLVFYKEYVNRVVIWFTI